MKINCLLVVVTCLILQVSEVNGGGVQSRGSHAPRRSRRSLFQMCDLIQRHTNRVCLDYYDYGCFCGLGNAGPSTKHLDDTDGCCRLHDNCYGEVTCLWTYPQIVGYNVQCDDDGCRCQDSQIWSPCARSVCECDLRFAQCLGRAQYNPHYQYYDWHLCNRT